MADPDPAPAPAPAPDPPTRRNEADLRAEAAAERIAKKQALEQVMDLRTKLEELTAQTEAKVTAGVSKITAKLTKIQARVVEAELKVAAQAAGLQDLDLLPLVDRAKILLTDDDEVTGVKEAIEELKVKKPDWFKAAVITAPATGNPPPLPAGGGTGGGTLDAKKMTPAEYAAFKRKTLQDLRH